jgi:hypothetical protein
VGFTLAIKGTVLLLGDVRSLGIMSEGSQGDKPVSLEKLLVDNSSSFQFHAAYLTYSDAFDKITDVEARKKLNENIVALQQNQIDYTTFYRNISQYRADNVSPPAPYSRTLIKTQRKRDWRRQTQKHERIQRHKK